jgi:phenylpropionate dioxygenase-like ring-hydroxylating dioxygenase large terminal subunit
MRYAGLVADPDPTPLIDTSKVAEPELRAHPLSSERYTSREFMRREWEQLWCQLWQIGCLEVELVTPGDFVTFQYGTESLIFVKDRAGRLRGFYNVCQHRGNQLTGAESGHTGAFVCPYHGWVWGTDGELQKVQDPEDFPQGAPCGRLRLAELRVETWAGFVWFTLATDGKSLAEFLEPIAHELDTYRMHTMVRTHHITLESDCNWKVVLDNFHESYHIPTVHPALKFFLNDTHQATQFDLYPAGHTRMLMPGGGPSPRAAGHEDLVLKVMTEELEMWQLEAESFRGRLGDMREALQRQKRALAGEKGFDYSRYVDGQLTDHYHYTVFPNLALSMKPDGCIFLRALPDPRDPEKCFFDVWYFTLFPEGSDEYVAMSMADTVRRGEETPHQRGKLGEIFLGGGIDEDASIFVSQQRGLRSRAFQGATLTHQERRVAWYHQVIDEYLDGSRS